MLSSDRATDLYQSKMQRGKSALPVGYALNNEMIYLHPENNIAISENEHGNYYSN